MGDITVLAHGGGAPEALTIGMPVAIFVGFVLMEWRARKREQVERERGELPERGGPAPDPDGG